MFKKTRIKIIIAVMASIIALLFGTLAIILGTSYAQMNTDNRRMLEQYVREYRIGDEKTDISDGKEKIDLNEPAPPMADNPPPETLHRFDVSTFYSVAIADNGTVLKTDNKSGTLYTDELLKSYAYEIIKGNEKTGRIKSLTYLKSAKSGYTLVAFIDNAIMQGGMATVFRNTLIFGGISVVAVFAISLFLARRIVAPLEESFRKQKQFISDAGHELKTPVSVVSANAELLCREIGENQWLSNIRYENERMGNLVKQLLTLAKTENVSVQTERLDFSRIVSGEILPFESVAFEQEVNLISDIANGIYVDGDSGRLKQLVSILIDNAIRHSESGGEVRAILKSDHGYAKLSVINDGKEIPPEQQKQIFERFYRIDTARSDDGHFGLGLAIAKAITDSHKGKIGISCHNGKIEFTVLIPQQKQAAPAH